MRFLFLCLTALLLRPDTTIGQPARINGVYYEIFVRSFQDSGSDGIGDINGLISRLDYLNDGNPATTTDLGITGIWLMPVQPSPSYHGYDVTSYYGINPEYGTTADFKRLLEESHKRGIRVVMDFVMNHCSIRHPWYEKARAGDPFYRDFFVWNTERPDTKGPWGQRLWHGREAPYHYGIFSGGLPDLNFNHPPVRDSLFAAARYWIKTIGIDGFRLDAVRYLYENGTALDDQPQTLQFLRDFADSVRTWNPAAFTVGEAWTGTAAASRYVTEGGLDYVFEFDLAGSLIETVRTGSSAPLHRQLGTVTNAYPDRRYGIFLTNHDQTRVIEELGDDLQKAELAAKLYLTLPGIPYLYYGEELGMRGAKPDEHIRRPMAWQNKPGAGFTAAPAPWIGLPEAWEQRNVETVAADSRTLFQAYRTAIHLRNGSPALSGGALHLLTASSPNILSYLRTSGGETVWITANLSAAPAGAASVTFPEGVLPEGRLETRRPVGLKAPKRLVIKSNTTRIDGLAPYEVRILRISAR